MDLKESLQITLAVIDMTRVDFSALSEKACCRHRRRVTCSAKRYGDGPLSIERASRSEVTSKSLEKVRVRWAEIERVDSVNSLKRDLSDLTRFLLHVESFLFLLPPLISCYTWISLTRLVPRAVHFERPRQLLERTTRTQRRKDRLFSPLYRTGRITVNCSLLNAIPRFLF